MTGAWLARGIKVWWDAAATLIYQSQETWSALAEQAKSHTFHPLRVCWGSNGTWKENGNLVLCIQMQRIENSYFQPPSLRSLSCYTDVLISKWFFITICPTNSSKQINGYEIAIVKSIPSKCEFFLFVFVAPYPEHPQGKHSWTETSQDWETVQKTSSFHNWQKKCSEKMCKRSSHPLKYYLSFDTFTIATGIKAQACQNI